MKYLMILAALGVGGGITWMDSRPNWDDTGVTAAAVLAASAVFGAWDTKRPWAYALAVGGGIPLLGILLTRNYGALIALAIAFAGAYLGAGLRGTLAPA